MQVRRLKGVSSERETFLSRAAQASAAACYYNQTMNRYVQSWLKICIEFFIQNLIWTRFFTFN